MSVDRPDVSTAEVSQLIGHLDKYLAIVRGGGLVVLEADGEAVATLGPPLAATVVPDPTWRPGRLAGRVRVAEDFDAPLPDSFWLGAE